MRFSIASVVALLAPLAAAADTDSLLEYKGTPAGQVIKQNVALRILPVGDSITVGFASSDGNGYRLRLEEDLSANDVVFAGTVHSGNMTDNYYAAWSGRTIKYMADHVGPSLKQRPNIILLHAGTNDMNLNPVISTEGTDPAGAAERLGSLIDQMIAACPDATILVAQIITTCDPAQKPGTEEFQALIPGVVEQRRNASHHVLAVDFEVLGENIFLNDCLHPTDQGYSIMGDYWYDAIAQIPKDWLQQPVGKNPDRSDDATSTGKSVPESSTAATPGSSSAATPGSSSAASPALKDKADHGLKQHGLSDDAVEAGHDFIHEAEVEEERRHSGDVNTMPSMSSQQKKGVNLEDIRMAPSTQNSHHFVVLGAGVIGLSTALTLRTEHPSARITILAEYFPGDYHIDYCSPWAGGNWCSSASDNGLLESFDRVTYHRFKEIASHAPEAGIKSSPLRMIFDQKIEDAGILSQETGKLWYNDLVGGTVPLSSSELPDKAVFGLDVPSTFVVNTQIYLKWLLEQCRQGGVSLIRRRIGHIKEARISPEVTTIFNCTGLGSYSLGGVEDKTMYPTRGQTILVEQPIQPLKRMYFRSPRRVDNDTTYIFQRPLAGGIVLGGCRQDGNWDKNIDPELTKTILERCCALAPELGRPEDLKIIKHGVGLRPGRKDGPRIEAELLEGGLVVHNYGASGAGYQASWGMAAHAVKLAKAEIERIQPAVSKL
ncbi:hypothetical protein EsH8_VII_001037 [Colletotrichum jinshuiense]